VLTSGLAQALLELGLTSEADIWLAHCNAQAKRAA